MGKARAMFLVFRFFFSRIWLTLLCALEPYDLLELRAEDDGVCYFLLSRLRSNLIFNS
jgi:hypothetical protein